jgi:hypothetical protein
MPSHTCKRCGYSTVWAKDLAKHLHKAIPCIPTDLDHFIPRDVLLEELQASKRKYVRKAPAAPPQTITNNINNNITNNINNDHSTHQHIHIHVNNFGEENLKYLKLAGGDGGELLKALPDLASLIRAIHYNPNHPENHNVCVTNLKDDVAFVMKDDEFQPASAKDCAEKLLLTTRRLWEVYESWNEDIEETPELAQWRALIKLMADKLSHPSERRVHKEVRKKQEEVLRVMHHESKKIWPEGSRDVRKSSSHDTESMSKYGGS